MGGSGSGASGWRVTTESALQLDIDTLVRRGVVRLGMHADGVMKFRKLAVEFESKAVDPKNNWLRLRYVIADRWTDEAAAAAHRAGG